MKESTGKLVRDGDPEFDRMQHLLDIIHEVFSMNRFTKEESITVCLNIIIIQLKNFDVTKEGFHKIIDHAWDQVE